ncbi:hypothetical protein SAMN05428975_5457 [Mucilaginibacter sp. OK268]|uniref:hypothetical protein n=1 Tax=Mucilaginibacter sp. OK268 TaxID=1881048 RepID=UPI00087F6A36|nr:hypothetical protein [Mucilaginibacter sp. OK268]SDQ00733.1 hypothetical protein SAMN05428975_5457 [Mucilaginibacter sp. OK268]
MILTVPDNNYSIQSCTYVVIWKKPLTTIPPLSTDFFKRLFQVEELEYGFSQQGLTVVLPQPNTLHYQGDAPNETIFQIRPAPTLLIGYQQMTFFHLDVNKLFSAYEGLVNELKNKYNAFYMSMLSGKIGINIEYFIKLVDGESTQKFFKERFLCNNDSSLEAFGFIDTAFQEVNIQLIEPGNDKLMQIKIQPLAGRTNELYILSNDHYGISPSENIFTIDQLKSYIDKSIGKMKTQVIPYLTNN